MADASLDDFFAKKDKSKKKSKQKQVTADITHPKVEDVSKIIPVVEKTDKKKKIRDKNTGTAGNPGTTKAEGEEEWIDFEDEKEKDYSGLRIQTLQMRDEEGLDEADEDEEGDEEGKDKDAAGPWNKGDSTNPQTSTADSQTHIEDSTPVPASKPAGTVTAGRYVPPSMRGQANASASGPPSHIRRKKVAPNLQSEKDFPTLGGSQPGSMAQAGQMIEAQHASGLKLTLVNKFDALQD